MRRRRRLGLGIALACCLWMCTTVLAQYDADPFHPTYTLEEISDAQGQCMYNCIHMSPRPEAVCQTELGLPKQWACQLANPDLDQRTPCENQMRMIEVSSRDCTCLRTSAGPCISPYEIMFDVWKHVPMKYRNQPRERTQQ